MGGTQFGNFDNFCRDSTLPVCNLFKNSPTQTPTQQFPGSELEGAGFNGCALTGINLSNGRHLANLGSILVCGLAIVTTTFLLWRAERKQAAVGRREFQLFLIGYIIISICEIFTVGGFPLDRKVRLGFTAAHLGSIVATLWVLLLNGVVGFQVLDDGTPMSLGLIVGSAIAFFVGTGYIALDTAFSYTSAFTDSLTGKNHNVALYVLYQLWPLICLFGFFVLESILVLRVLGEKKPMLYLIAATLLFALGQIFQYVVSTHICNGSKGRIDGAFFESLFTLLSVIVIFVFWSSITEDDWPSAVGENPYNEPAYK